MLLIYNGGRKGHRWTKVRNRHTEENLKRCGDGIFEGSWTNMELVKEDGVEQEEIGNICS